jgi:hypothetical protein
MKTVCPLLYYKKTTEMVNSDEGRRCDESSNSASSNPASSNSASSNPASSLPVPDCNPSPLRFEFATFSAQLCFPLYLVRALKHRNRSTQPLKNNNNNSIIIIIIIHQQQVPAHPPPPLPQTN